MNQNTTGGYTPNPLDKQPAKYECKHNFFKVKDDPKEWKVIIVCAWCGQVRELSSNGQVAVLKHKGNLCYEV